MCVWGGGGEGGGERKIRDTKILFCGAALGYFYS